jgi:mannose-6-phosphate isomerase-like protein (cupin superfamily)
MSKVEHVTDELNEYALDILTEQRAKEVKDHLRTCRPCSQELGVISDLLVQSLQQEGASTPPADLRSRILQDVSAFAPYSLYHQEMASVLSGTEAGLRNELESMPHPRTWAPGPIPRCRLFPCVAAAAPRDAIRTLVLMESGSHFPMHEHLGDETVLIVQGSMQLDDGQVHRPGDVLRMAAGTSHAFDVPVGLDLIYLAHVDRGLQIGEQEITAASLAASGGQERTGV